MTILMLALALTAAQPQALPPLPIADGQALRQAGVPAELHVFERGPHGVGLANNDPALTPWSVLMANWLRVRGFIK